MSDEIENLGSDDFPWEHVQAARNDDRLQRRHSTAKAKEHYAASAKHCPQCNAAPDALQWFYFQSPAETWKMLCGRAGWITVCDKCQRQVNFFLEVMN